MAKKKEETAEAEQVQQLELSVGVNFREMGKEKETRIEAGLINSGILPPAFEVELIERGLAKYVG